MSRGKSTGVARQEQSAPSSALPWRPELDVLRSLAFLVVFLHHALPQSRGPYELAGLPRAAAEWLAAAVLAGAYGVDLFFCLSGYLITEILMRESRSSGSIDVRAFWIRRILRIWPLYFAFLFLTRTLVPLILPNDHLSTPHLLAFLGFAGNWSTAILGYPPSVAAPLWSVSIEEQFYLVWPVLLTLAGVHRMRLAAALLAISFAARAFLVATSTPHPGVWCNTLSRLDPMAAGALIAFVLKGRTPDLAVWPRALLGIAGLFGIIAVGRYGGFYGQKSLLSYPIAAAGSAACLVAVLGVKGAWAKKPMGIALIWLGKVSFGLYVFHEFALLVAGQLALPGISGKLVQASLALPVTVILAAASYRWVESPFLRLKSRFARVAA